MHTIIEFQVSERFVNWSAVILSRHYCFSRNGQTKTTGDNIIQAPDGQGCPRCGGFVYHADQVFSKGELRIFFRIFY